jgi:hypothetical protein
MIIGIVVGVVAFLLIVGIYIKCRNKKANDG